MVQSLFEKIISSTARSLKHWIPFSMVFQRPCCSWKSSWQRYLSFTLIKSHVQRWRGSGFPVIPWSMPTSCEKDPKCLPPVPSKIVAQTPINQLNMGSSVCQVWSFHTLRRLSQDKDLVIIFSSESSAVCKSPVSPLSSTGEKYLVLYFLLWAGVTAIGFSCPFVLTAA